MSEHPKVLQLVRPKPEPDPDLLKKAEKLIELVRGGEITGMAFVVTFSDGAVGTLYDHTETGSLFALLGGVDYLHRRVMAKVEE